MALSPALAVMQVSPEVGMGAIRFGRGRATTEAEVDVVEAIAEGMRAEST